MQKLGLERKEMKGMEFKQDVKIGECFKKESIINYLEIKLDKKKNVCVVFGSVKVMVNLVRDILESDRKGRQMELIKNGVEERQWRQ